MMGAWENVRLGDVCRLINGRAYKKPELLENGKYPVLRVGNFFTNRSWYYSDLELEADKYCDDGDLLYAWSASFGPRIWQGGKVIYHYHIWKTDMDCSRVEKEFLFYWFDWDKERIKSEQGAGTTMIHVTKGSMESRNLLLPPLPEQKRIVAILDEAFAGIDAAVANSEKNLANARELFESYLNGVFTWKGDGWVEKTLENGKDPAKLAFQNKMPSTTKEANAEKVTKTGGRNATLRYIPGDLSLAVGMPSTETRRGWRWTPLSDLARLESGHTPSRKHPEYWDGTIPWIGIKDARANHGRCITDTIQKTNELGIENSSARILPENTVCLSRTASVGYVMVMGKPMATSQDFVNWVCSNRLNPDFLKYLFFAEGREGLLKYASGSVHQTIYFPEAKAFHICHPNVAEQVKIIGQCDLIRDETQRLESVYQRKLDALDELKKSLLHQAFSGQL